MDPSDYWKFLPIGYLFSVAIETPILCVGLSPRHALKDRILAGFWLTACTYPIVVIALPLLMLPASPYWVYLLVGESVAHFGEPALFWAAYGSREERWKPSMWRDLGVVFLANLASFLIGDRCHVSDWIFSRIVAH